MKLRCGLIGRRLSHSYSPEIHALLGDYDYKLIELEPEQVESFLRTGAFDALNVTIPYKMTALRCCDELSPLAREVGSVNTLLRRKDGTLYGTNTDCDGFRFLLRQLKLSPRGKKALVLGSGGAAAAVRAVLQDEEAASVVTVSRSGPVDYRSVYEHHPDAALIVNATPVGMAPDVGRSLIDPSRFPSLEAVADLIYNPSKTRLLLDAEAIGVPCVNGLGMLVAQAKASSELFTGETIPDERIPEIAGRIERRMKNLFLIGMPGSGKSTVGRLISERTGRPFADLDFEIERAAGRSCAELIETDGEACFRSLETAALAALSARSGLVVACGGGVVTRPENLVCMRQNGTVVWLRRELALLPSEGRPLSRTLGAEELYRQREPLYRKAAEYFTDNAGTPEQTAEQIIRELKL